MDENENTKTIIISEMVHRRLKAYAATTGGLMLPVADVLLTDALARAEKREQRKATKAEG